MSELVGGGGGFVWETPPDPWVLANSGAAAAAAAAATKENEEPVVVPRGKKRAATVGANKRCTEKVMVGESDHEIHIWTERERRKKMRNMFSNLHALLPQLPPKADKSTIVDEAVSYIRSLENTLEKLQNQKVERQVVHGINNPHIHDHLFSREAFLADQPPPPPPAAAAAPSSACNNITQTMQLPPTFGGAVAFQTWTSPNVIFNVCGDDAHISICSSSANKRGLLTAILYVLDRHRLEVVSAQVSSHNGTTIYMIQAHASPSHELAETSSLVPVEEIYKQAAAEMNLWVNRPAGII